MSSLAREGPTHLSSSEEDEMSGVVVPKCRVDSGEDGSISSANGSPKVTYTAPMSIVEMPNPGTPRGRSAKKQQASLNSKKNGRKMQSPSSGTRAPEGHSSSVRQSDPAQKDRADLDSTSFTVGRPTSVLGNPIDGTSPCDGVVMPLAAQQESQPPQLEEATRIDHASNDGAALKPTEGTEVDEELTCCICMEGYSGDNPMFRGACRHHFHLPCLLSWKQRSNSCPMCCSETLRGVGDLEDDDPAHAASPSSQQGENVAADEAMAVLLQRKYLRRAKRRAEERKRNTAVQQQQQQPPQVLPTGGRERIGDSSRPSPHAAPAPTTAVRPLPLSPPISSDGSPQTAAAAKTTTPNTGYKGVAVVVEGSGDSRTRQRNAMTTRTPKGKTECTVM